MNFLRKTTPWVAASVLTVASLFGQDKEKSTDKMMNGRSCKSQDSFQQQGEDILKAQVTPSYTAPAGIQVRGSWDFYVNGTFIYWQPTQDNMEYGTTNTLYAANLIGNTSSVSGGLNGTELQQSFSFQPGFKIGLGMNTDHDNWDVYAEYTWLRDETTSKSAAPSGGCILPKRGLAFDTSTGAQIPNVYNTASQTWTCNFDFLNLEMGRNCYVGRALTLRPSFGVRGTIMRQKLLDVYENTSITITPSGGVPTPLGVSIVEDFVHSWSAGPRAALNGNWLLGSRFRVYGNMAGDITFTQYNVQEKTKFYNSTSHLSTKLTALEHNLGAMREHVELELGFGWGTYFDNDNWYFDLSAGYTWQVFFDQNMFRASGTLVDGGNLYINGLTVNVRFDF